MSNLANLYNKQGKYAEAEPLYRRTLSVREQQGGPDHRDTAETYHDLAALREQQGNHQEALALYQCALAIREQAIGAEHPDTRTTRKRFAALKDRVGQEAGTPSVDDSSPELRE